MRPGQRVYWHGVFPDPFCTGTIVRTGEIRHEVHWDGGSRADLVQVSAVAALSKVKRCCPYCTDKLALRKELLKAMEKLPTRYRPLLGRRATVAFDWQPLSSSIPTARAEIEDYWLVDINVNSGICIVQIKGRNRSDQYANLDSAMAAIGFEVAK